MMKVDVVIFSKGRERELISSLRRLSKTKFRILVFHNNLQAIQVPNEWKNVEYYFCPNLNLGERAMFARDSLQNPFSIICSDDDGLVESQLNKMIRFLENNQDYASVGGLVVGAFTYGSRINGSRAYVEMNGYENSVNSDIERLKLHLTLGIKNSLPRAGMYRLYRKSGMDSLLLSLASCNALSTPYIYEVVSEFVSAKLGPTIYLPYVYWIRNWNTKMITHKNWDRDFDFCDWWQNEHFSLENEKFVQVLAMKLELESGSVYELISRYAEIRKFIAKPRSKRHVWTSDSLSLAKRLIYERLLPGKLPIEFSQFLRKEFTDISMDELEEISNVAKDMFNLTTYSKDHSKC